MIYIDMQLRVSRYVAISDIPKFSLFMSQSCEYMLMSHGIDTSDSNRRQQFATRICAIKYIPFAEHTSNWMAALRDGRIFTCRAVLRNSDKKLRYNSSNMQQSRFEVELLDMKQLLTGNF